MTEKQCIEQVLGMAETKKIWSAGYRNALPVTPQEFSIGGVLPVILYMMRWGHRRGVGNFIKTYRTDQNKKPTINNVVAKLSQDKLHFDGFEDETEKAILGDLLLAFNLENRNHSKGRDEQVQRVYPTHYYSSWIDLPETSANLRYIPELITTLLTKNSLTTLGNYQPKVGYQNNLLLKVFGEGMSIRENSFGSMDADQFDENVDSVEQLLTIRIAQSMALPPQKIGGENADIPSQLPITKAANRRFYEDFNLFLRSYGTTIPRQSLVPMLEACIGIGVSNIFLSSICLLTTWGTGHVIDLEKESSWPLFVDCSAGEDSKLRRASEVCMEVALSSLSRVPVIMMCLQIMDQVSMSQRISGLPSSIPNAVDRINFLGNLITGSDEIMKQIKYDLNRQCNLLENKLVEHLFTAPSGLTEKELHPAWRLAEGIVSLMEDKLQYFQFRKFLDSSLMANETHGLCRKRKIRLNKRNSDQRSLVLSNPALDFLAHRHMAPTKVGGSQHSISFTEFLKILREHYGYYIDVSPPNIMVATELLNKNRVIFEQRLRDMGLLSGVNDAESMKRLKSRYGVKNANTD